MLLAAEVVSLVRVHVHDAPDVAIDEVVVDGEANVPHLGAPVYTTIYYIIIYHSIVSYKIAALSIDVILNYMYHTLALQYCAGVIHRPVPPPQV